MLLIYFLAFKLSQLIWGTRVSLIVGGLATFIALLKRYPSSISTPTAA